MTDPRDDAIALASRLLQYPVPGYGDDLEAFIESCSRLGCEVTPGLRAFADEVNGCSLESLQEMFTQTFDLSLDCALEVGWHLFGGDYKRGGFLVDMRDRLRSHGIRESTDLPDHLALLLALVTRLDREEADLLIAGALVPAIDKMRIGLRRTGSPFDPVVSALYDLLAARVGSAT